MLQVVQSLRPLVYNHVLTHFDGNAFEQVTQQIPA